MNIRTMAEMSGARALMDSLEKEGVDIVFGLPGGANLPIYDALS
jgi:acetolactate synthase-1/2/3 large subunit